MDRASAWASCVARALLMCLALGCAGGKESARSRAMSESEMQILCFAETRSDALVRFPFADKLGTMNAWLERELGQGGVRALYFERLPETPAHLQGQLLRDEAARAGVASCPTAGLLDFLADLPREGLGFDDCVAACLARNRGLDGASDDACKKGCGG